ncbi:MAG: peptidyl-prolyl cis-trans isomerase [Anderseniella sp.]
MLVKIVRDPLAHFFALGLCLFLLYTTLNPVGQAGDDPKRIVVDHETLLTFLQYRTKTFKRDLAEARLKAMPNKQLKKLIDDYVREEALHREAKALGLGAEDYIIKRRMIQKVEFITQGFAGSVVKVGDEDIKAYYAANKEHYREPGNITFTHVFFDAEGRKPSEARTLASEKLELLRTAGATFSDAPGHGDRFPYGVNFVERTIDHVASHFGKEMAETLFKLEPTEGVWQGPFESSYGAHLVMVVKRVDDRTPQLGTIKSRVEADLVRTRRKEQADRAVQAIVDGYEVKLEIVGRAGEKLVQLKKAN